MLLATLLLAVPTAPHWAQVTPPSDSAPTPANEEAKAADAAYQSWLKGLPEDFGGPMHVDFALQLKSNFIDDFSDTSIHFDLSMSSDIQDMHRMRHTMTGSFSEVGSEETLEFSATILLDGTHFWVMVKANQDDLVPAGGFLAKGDQKMLEGLYRLYLEAMPAMVSLIEEEEGMGMESGLISAAMSSALGMMPKEIGGYLHPAAYFRTTAPALGCRSFRQEGSNMLAEMYIDSSPGSMFGDLIGSFDEMFAGSLDNEGIEFGPMMRKMIDSLGMTAQFDAATGVPTGISVDWQLNLAEFGIDENGENMHLIANGTGAVERLESIDPSLFAAPKSADRALDVTMFLQMAKSQLDGMLSEIAGEEEDMAF